MDSIQHVAGSKDNKQTAKAHKAVNDRLPFQGRRGLGHQICEQPAHDLLCRPEADHHTDPDRPSQRPHRPCTNLAFEHFLELADALARRF